MDRGLLDRQRLDLAFRQDPGRLSEQEQRTEAIQDYIQHDPSPWRLRPSFKAPALQETRGMWRHVPLGFHGEVRAPV